MNNAQWCLEQGIKFKDLTGCSYTLSAKPQFMSIGYYDINRKYHECYKGEKLEDTIYESILAWLDMDHKEPILDAVEKRYLSTLIRPFRNEIKVIEKDRCFGNRLERLYFYMKDGEVFYFKLFKMGTMYKGMEPKKMYSLEELGL